MAKDRTATSSGAGATKQSKPRSEPFGAEQRGSSGQHSAGSLTPSPRGDAYSSPSTRTRENEAPEDYRPSSRALVVTRETSQKPSVSVVVGAALVGAVAAAAIPFMFAGRGHANTRARASSGQRNLGERRNLGEQRIPILEEQLVVGKKNVARGGAQVHSYIKETPVHEQVSLREEHVSLERQPMNRKLGEDELSASGILEERNVAMTEMAEEAVVEKEARLREELVVRKTATERVQDVEGTVRHTEVEVDEGDGTRRGRDGH